MSASSTIVRAGVSKHHFRSSSRAAKCCLVATQCSAVRRRGSQGLRHRAGACCSSPAACGPLRPMSPPCAGPQRDTRVGGSRVRRRHPLCVYAANQVNVPSDGRGACMLNQIGQLQRPFVPAGRRGRITVRGDTAVARRLAFGNVAHLALPLNPLHRLGRAVRSQHLRVI